MQSLLKELPSLAPEKDTLLTIGVFDGLHLGHHHLLRQLLKKAQSRSLQPGVLTFRNHPLEVLRPEITLRLIAPLEESLQPMRDLGIDLVVPITFTREVSMLRPQQFVSLLQDRLRMKGLVVGTDFALGHDREGDIQTLQHLGQQRGFTVDIVEPFYLGDQVVSSTSVRATIEEGRVREAARLLGRHFALRGKVVHGAGRGAGLGFPTANLEWPKQQVLPGDGVYATWAHVQGARHPSATSVGDNPTFGPGQRTVEAFLFDFKGVLYQQEVKLEFVERLRGQIRFDDKESLIAQMNLDVQQAQAILADAKPVQTLRQRAG